MESKTEVNICLNVVDVVLCLGLTNYLNCEGHFLSVQYEAGHVVDQCFSLSAMAISDHTSVWIRTPRLQPSVKPYTERKQNRIEVIYRACLLKGPMHPELCSLAV
jgi:hypothetical protein